MLVLTRAGYALPGTSLNFKTGTWRVQKPLHQHRSAPCHTACPAGENAQAYIADIQAGHSQAAWETLVKINPLPAITGRVCPHACESACNRGGLDEPIAIHAIERSLGDQAIDNDWAYPVEPLPKNAPEIAVVGAGPAGLAAAYHLVRLGYRSTIFDDRTEPGGTLRTALPPYRLPRTVLDAEINRVLAIDGISFKPHTRLGRDVNLRELQADYPAVFLGVGAQQSQEWNIDGVVPRDLHSGLELLKEWVDIGTVPTPKSVAIVGAGNTAVDMARVMKRAGVPEVHIISHKPIPKPGIPQSEAMPAIAREVEEALEEGVIIHEYRGIRRLILRGERVVGVELVHMKKMKQESGRLKRVAFAGTETILNVDQVIPAVGQVIDPYGMEKIAGMSSFLPTDHWGHIDGHSGIYGGGDAGGKAGTVTAAIGDGRRAAIAIDKQIRNEALPTVKKDQPIEFDALNMHYYEPAARMQEPVLPVEKRVGEEEIVSSLTTAEVTKEAARCFSCGNCLACDNCWTLCPDSAVLKTKDLASDGSHYVFDYDYCKGCGLCASECPCGYIEMHDEL
ncbi:NAD(P)-binding protein [Candidatus Albibeggiatoa sp. nov. NOAA]|uniref:NAD(P)-binding protein n=1 Tax=Candidatus Albibeggiatoa sp. nov. NOAA TaxID=3162724 RepID=UPI0032F82FE4|nr:NAD(P)-binding protein [Thiotrichaceae bacterium]